MGGGRRNHSDEGRPLSITAFVQGFADRCGLVSEPVHCQQGRNGNLDQNRLHMSADHKPDEK